MLFPFRGILCASQQNSLHIIIIALTFPIPLHFKHLLCSTLYKINIYIGTLCQQSFLFNMCMSCVRITTTTTTFVVIVHSRGVVAQKADMRLTMGEMCVFFVVDTCIG